MNPLNDSSSEIDDSALVRRLKRGDHEAFEALYARHAPRVFRQAIRMLNNESEAEEVLQEVFVTVYKKIQQFRGAAAFSTWLYRLTANATITKLRKRKRNREVAIEDYLPEFDEDGHHKTRPVIDWSQDLEAALLSDETQKFLRQALDNLPPTDKAVVVLSDLEGFSNKEIAKMLGLTVAAVKARLHRGRLFLRGRLAAYFGQQPV